MKSHVLSIDGKKLRELQLPEAFSSEIRHDIIAKVLEAKKTMQPYGPSPVAGKQHAAKGKVVHRRHVWRSGYGRGSSRVPRKIFLRRGTQFNWEAAEVPHARGGMRAHPPKPISMVNTLKVNKKELSTALKSALSATVNPKEIASKYNISEKANVNAPFIVESKISNLKSKQLLDALKKIFGEGLFEMAVKKRKIRSGKGKLRGRRYKKSAGALIVLGHNETLKANFIDIKNANNLGVLDLAKGGAGRLVLYTESAINDLNEKFSKSKAKPKTSKVKGAKK